VMLRQTSQQIKDAYLRAVVGWKWIPCGQKKNPHSLTRQVLQKMRQIRRVTVFMNGLMTC
jgi:hypothetical protein